MAKSTKSKPKRRSNVQERRRKRRQQEQKRTFIYIGVGVLAVLLLILWPTFAPLSGIVEITPKEYANANGKTLGNPDAPVTVEVYEDFNCSHCKSFSEDTKPLIIENFVNTGQVLLVFRNFPILDPGYNGNSTNAARASMCAADQDDFWNYEEILFANAGSSDALSERRLKAFAEIIGLNTDEFNSCYDSGKFDVAVQDEVNFAREQEFTGTPTVVVNGFRTVDFSYPSIEAAITNALLAEEATGE